VAARRAHNPKVGGSNPSPATNLLYISKKTFNGKKNLLGFFFFILIFNS
jgi:hypothetical protein